MSENKLVQLLNQYKHEHTIMETGKSLQIKPITTGMMKSVLQYEGVEEPNIIDSILDDIVNGCVVDTAFNIDDLTIQDRFELLIGIRKISKGDNYTFTIKCPQCGSESIQSVDLDTLELTPYKQIGDDKVVINDGLSLSFTHVRRGHQKEAFEIVKRMGKMTDLQMASETATYLYAFAIDGIYTKQGKLDDFSIEDKKEFLDNLEGDAYDGINKWFEDHNYGTKFKYSVVCKAGCGFNKEEDIPITGFFF